MKTFNYLFTTIIIAALIGLAGACEPVTNPDPIPAIDSTQTATIQGSVYANLDESNDDTGDPEQDFEEAPQGTVIKVVLDAGDFGNLGATGNSLTYTTEVSGSGTYEIEVPAQADPINAEIYLDSFTATQTQADDTEEETTFEPEQFPYNVQITADLKSYNDMFYQAN